MSNLEIVAVLCPECEQMVGVGENHACWSQELGMRAFEAAMWKKWKQEEGNPIELEDDEYEAWMANETRHCHENGLAFPISGEAMLAEMRDLEALVPSEFPWVWPCGLCGNLQDPNVNWEGIPANCSRCSCYICHNHGGVDAEGNIWCENCAEAQGIRFEEESIPGCPSLVKEHLMLVDPRREEL